MVFLVLEAWRKKSRFKKERENKGGGGIVNKCEVRGRKIIMLLVS